MTIHSGNPNQIVNEGWLSSNPSRTSVKANTSLNVVPKSCTNSAFNDYQFNTPFLNLTPVMIPLSKVSEMQEPISASSSITTSSHSSSFLSSAFCSASSRSVFSEYGDQSLLLDPFSYISDVFDNVIAPLVTGPSPIFSSIRIIMIKRLLLDKAAHELPPGSIATFEELYNFIIDLLRRTNLLG